MTTDIYQAAGDGGQRYPLWNFGPGALEKHEADRLDVLGATPLSRCQYWREIPAEPFQSGRLRNKVQHG